MKRKAEYKYLQSICNFTFKYEAEIFLPILRNVEPKSNTPSTQHKFMIVILISFVIKKGSMMFSLHESKPLKSSYPCIKYFSKQGQYYKPFSIIVDWILFDSFFFHESFETKYYRTDSRIQLLLLAISYIFRFLFDCFNV